MKKQFYLFAAVLFGVLFTFASCKDNKHRSHHGDDEDDEELVDDDDDYEDEDNTKSSKKGTVKLADLINENKLDELADLDIDDVDATGVDFNKLNNLDFDNLDQSTADLLLQVAVAQMSSELPMDAGDGIVLSSFAVVGNDVKISMIVDEKELEGLNMKAFEVLLNNEAMKKQLMAQMVSSMDADGKFAINVIAAAKKNFVMEFVGGNTGETAMIRLTSSELKQLIK